MKHYSVAICGAGPVGKTLALLFIHHGMRPEDILLIDAKDEAHAVADKRSIALSYGSQRILTTAGAWPIHSTPIHRIHVSQANTFGRAVITSAEYNLPALGYVAYYRDIMATLHHALHPYRNQLSIHYQTSANQLIQRTGHVELVLNNLQTVSANIVVQAEGGVAAHSSNQEVYQYNQHAIVTNVMVSHPIPYCAYERFTEEGPLALLPQERGYALVWCVRPENSPSLMAANDITFLHALHTRFKDRLGSFIHCSARQVFPLKLSVQHRLPEGRIVAIGNAAQTLHPVGGQGLNLGLRDAWGLSQKLARTTDSSALQHFYKARKADRHRVITLTHQLAQLFTGRHMVKQNVLGLSLSLLDTCPPLKEKLAKQMIYGLR